MRTMIQLLALLAVIVLMSVPAQADEMISFRAGYLTLSPDGEFAVSNGTVGDRVDVRDDLSFDDSEEFQAEAALQLGPFRLSAGYLPLQFSGSGVLTDTVEFGGETFPVDALIDSDIDLDIYDVGLTWHLLNFDDLPVRLQLGPEISVKYVNADISFKDLTHGVEESESVNAPIPTVGLRGRVGFSDFVGLVGRVGYLDYDDNSFLDADVQLEFSPVPLVGAFVGYRYFDIEVEEDDIFLDITFDGPYGGLFVRF